jgi:hypothetical protein
MYLAAISPSVEDVRRHIAFLDEKEEIDNAKFEDFYETKPAILEMQAKRKEISLFVYKEELLIPARKKALKELEERYGFSVDNSRNDPREALRQKYKKIQEKSERVADLAEKARLDKIKRINQLYDLPENKEEPENKA